jgi:hypothetical protein
MSEDVTKGSVATFTYPDYMSGLGHRRHGWAFGWARFFHEQHD